MQIDPRSSQTILAYMDACARAPDWPVPSNVFQSDAGQALARIFSEMAELIVTRLNKAPDNNLLAFLDVLGVKLLAPQPAIAPVTFLLSSGAPGGVLIPEQTVVTAGDVHFQTDRTMWAIQQSLVAVFAYNPVQDRLFACPDFVIKGLAPSSAAGTLTSDAAAGESMLCVDSSDKFKKSDMIYIGMPDTGDAQNTSTIEYATIAKVSDGAITLVRPLGFVHTATEQVNVISGFGITAGENIQLHCLYIGHADLFNLNAGKSAILNFTGGELPANRIWAYYGEDRNKNADWQPLIETINAGNIVLSGIGGEIKKFKVNGIESRWIRCSTQTLNQSSMPQTITIVQDVSSSVQANFDSTSYNDVPIAISNNPINPFSSRPCQGDAFYIASQEAFSKPGSTITITITDFRDRSQDASETGKAYTLARSNLSLSWEYWDGNGWAALPGLTGATGFNLIDGFSSNGNLNTCAVTFVCPAFADTVVAGQANKWMRIKISGGDYGRDVMYIGNSWQASTVVVPKVSLALQYQSVAASALPQKCLTTNNLTMRDYSGQIAAGQPIVAFEFLGQDDQNVPALYFGFNDRVENGPVSLFFSLSENLSLAHSLDCSVRWYCFTKLSGWRALDTIDNTGNLTRSGTIEFLFPSDFESQTLFGQTLFWIKASFEGAPAINQPLVNALYLNTVPATQAQTIRDETVGESNAQPDQTFVLNQFPVIDCQLWVDEINSISEEEKALLLNNNIQITVVPGQFGVSEQCWVEWTNVYDFLSSGADDRHYVLDMTNGQITFGNGESGMIPPPGTENIKATYRVGGGSAGNVSAAAIDTLKTSIQFVGSVSNPQQASGGADAETVDSVKQRGPNLVSHRNRAVTEQDFEQLAAQAAVDIKRTKCYTNNGVVHVIVVPNGPGDAPVSSLAEKETIEQKLAPNCLTTVLATAISVDDPDYFPVNTQLTIVPLSMDQAVVAQNAVVDALKSFLHPITGGADGNGWEFGRPVRLSDLYAILGEIGTIDHIADLKLWNGTDFLAQDVDIGDHSIACSGTHAVTVTMEGQ